MALAVKKARRQLVVVEGIYSMDGDFGNLQEVLDVAERMARAFSSMKRTRCSLAANTVAELRRTSAWKDRFPLVYGTFSKAFGALGGFRRRFEGDASQYLRFYAHPYVYSCALPPVVIAAILKALEIGTSEPELRAKLWENADYFHAQLASSESIPEHRQLT